MRRIIFATWALLLAVSVGQGAEENGSGRPNPVPTVFIGAVEGDAADAAMRPLLTKMGERLGQSFAIVNRSGLAGATAAEEALRLPATGRVLLAVGSGSFGGFLAQNTAPGALPWVWRGFYAFRGPAVLIVNPALSRIDAMDDLVRRLRDGGARVGVNELWGGTRTLMEAFAEKAGIGRVEFQDLGSDADVVRAVEAGRVEAGVVTLFAVVERLRTGAVKALFVNQERPFHLTHCLIVPPVTAVVPGSLELTRLAEGWGLLVRRETPEAEVDAIADAFRWALKQPEIRDFAAMHGLEAVALSGEDADKFADRQFAAAAWILHDAGAARFHPGKYDVPRAEEWTWEGEKWKYEIKKP